MASTLEMFGHNPTLPGNGEEEQKRELELSQKKGEARRFRTGALTLLPVTGEEKMVFGNGVTQEVISDCLYCFGDAREQLTEGRHPCATVTFESDLSLSRGRGQQV